MFSSYRVRRVRFVYAAAAALIVAIIAATPIGAATGASEKDVFVTNTAADPVPTTIVGTPSVNVANTPTVTVANTPASPVPVKQVEQPYIVRLSANNLGAPGEECAEIPVPSGTRLVLETVAIDVVDDLADPGGPEAHVRMALAQGGGMIFDRPLVIPLTPTGGAGYEGHLRTRVLSGPVTVGSGTVELALCAGDHTLIEGFVVGRLLPL